MVIPANVLAAVEAGDISTVVAWLDAGGDVNDVTPAWPGVRGWPSGKTLLMAIPQTDTIGPRQVELVRILLQRGADVNKIYEVENSNHLSQALHFCLECLPHPRTWDKSEGRAAILEIIGIYLAAGASLTQRNNWGYTPLGMALSYSNWCGERTESVRLLLRAGASLDACYEDWPAEVSLRQLGRTRLKDDADFFECHEMVRGVRAAGGSWKEYVRAPPKALLRLPLALRARPRTREREESSDAREDAARSSAALRADLPERALLARSRVLEPALRASKNAVAAARVMTCALMDSEHDTQ